MKYTNSWSSSAKVGASGNSCRRSGRESRQRHGGAGLVEAELLRRVVDGGVGVLACKLLGHASATLEGHVLHVQPVGAVEEVGQELVFLTLAGAGHDPVIALGLGRRDELFHELMPLSLCTQRRKVSSAMRPIGVKVEMSTLRLG